MSRHTVVGLHLDAAVVPHVLDPTDPARREEFGRSIDEAGIDFVVLGGDRPAAGHVTIDATVAATVLARHTTSVSLVAASAPVRDHPFNLARRLGSLDHGSHGRVGWLIGSDPLSAAVDAVWVVRKLWESWPGDSIVDDAEHGIFAESERIVYIDHAGTFSVSGPLNVPEPPQRKLPVFWRPGNEAELVAARRTADAVILAEEDAVRRYRTHFDPDAARDQVVLLDLDRPIPASLLGGPPDPATFSGSLGFRESVVGLARERNLTVVQLLRELDGGGGHRAVIGTPHQVADTIEAWFRAEAADGFNLMPDALPSGLDTFVDEVVPLLRKRGLFRHDYAEKTLRERFAVPLPEHSAARSA
ncbi:MULTISPECIES: LLM class flavin-dependent oxidoreductase [unclassified Rhodococcus (in: high G+C Gram-positive bacteria)]|uniref:LLM class flavin-dependent oxidoreductase n=1 Tax=unclassified Rhodococcus (in: high G+C Gram-positive bacteria) TaxID=192944 RepID=UPI00163ACF88|nr:MULTISPECIES: LLM class flavin-dependent oxidoreductase [unclassified Rhodococcus (in: high G+C Gram-positive bacteria)]MBC2639127.1 LLM class flavin-dependent oxidoreductase [Rhodococcus sp. 3A]MBC2896131.1 LLM class flavin-dependent oxidoreductase [Rhodococcus sp. 4CII]